ncbi:MAG TPA: hypothetical protein VMF91_04085 [Bryobacteraceae bacterium]|nr:hypothetical protein [Bryobacteraceae bacterium]
MAGFQVITEVDKIVAEPSRWSSDAGMLLDLMTLLFEKPRSSLDQRTLDFATNR